MIIYPDLEIKQGRLAVDTKTASDRVCFVARQVHDDEAQGVVLDRDSVAALVGQLQSWLERTAAKERE